MADVSKVHSNLVRPTGTEADPEEGMAGSQVEPLKLGHGGSAVGKDRHTLPVLWIPADGSLDPGTSVG
jgi:hypothetical protein